jgi:hypothetical protein
MFAKRPKKRSVDDLRRKFEALGVQDIEFQIEDELDDQSNPRLAPLVLFHNIWGAALRKGDTEWLEETIRHFENRKNLTGIVAAVWPQEDDFLEALLALKASGVDLKHVTTIAKRAQEHLLHHVAYTLSDSHSDEEEFKDVHWAVFETDKDGNPLRQMNVLHEYYGLVDPDAEAV